MQKNKPENKDSKISLAKNASEEKKQERIVVWEKNTRATKDSVAAETGVTKHGYTKEMMCNALRQAGGYYSKAAEIIGCAPALFNYYRDIWPELEQTRIEIREAQLDRAENMLMKRMKESDTLLIFYLKTQGKKRGYTERIDINLDVEINVKIEGMDTLNKELEDLKESRIVDISDRQ